MERTPEQMKLIAAFNAARINNEGNAFKAKQISRVLNGLGFHGKGVVEAFASEGLLNKVEVDDISLYEFKKTPPIFATLWSLKLRFDEPVRTKEDRIKEAIELLKSTGEYEIRRKIVRVEYEEIC